MNDVAQAAQICAGSERGLDASLLDAAAALAWAQGDEVGPLHAGLGAKGRIYGQLRLDPAAARWVLSGIEPHVAIRLKRMFPKLPKEETKAFTFADTSESAADLEWFLERYPMEIAPADRERLAAGRQAFERVRDETERILLPTWKPSLLTGFRAGFEPHPNQVRAIELGRLRRRVLNMDDVGLGKTEAAIGTINSREFLPAAVVCEAHLASQWADRIKLRTHLRPHVIMRTQPYDLPEADVYIFRYSNIDGWPDIAATGLFRSVVFDEIQSLRNGTMTCKGAAARVFADNAAMRIGLTATPVYNYGSEMFEVVEFIERGALGTRDEFFREWCTFNGKKWIVDDPDALGTYLRDLQLVVREVRSGRPVNRIIHEVDFDHDVADQSLDLARTLALKVTTGSFTERGQAARELDMLARQVTGVAKAKHVAAFVRILLEAGTPVVLAGWHREVYEIWLRELQDFRPVMYTGTETPKAKDWARDAFASGWTNLFILSLRSGTGLDGLQHRCSTVVFGELDWSPKVHEQVIGRLDRPGQQNEVTAIFLVADSGSDPLLTSVLGLKASQARGITDPMAGVEHVYSDESRIKALAELYLSRAGDGNGRTGGAR